VTKAGSLSLDQGALRRLLGRLLKAHGPQHWWPHQGHPFEIMIGAVLTQNTAWTNVEKAIDRLRAADALEAGNLLARPAEEVAELIRPSGYFNVKTRRLLNLCEWYVRAGGFDSLKTLETDRLRSELLSISGVGPETCDDILLYAFGRAVFVVDAYTFRLFERLGLIGPGHSYESLRAAVERAMGDDVDGFNELHALIVRHCNGICRPRPLCEQCDLHRQCEHFLYNR